MQSTLPVNSHPFCDLLKLDSQSAALLMLPPLPFPFTSNTTMNALPSFALPGFTSLPLPPRSHSSKPPLPPRSSSLSSTPPKPIPRISNPFASLFGKPPPPTSVTTSPSPSQISLPSEEVYNPLNVSVDVSGFSIGKKVVRNAVGKEVSKLIREEIKSGLMDCPTWVVERVIA